MEKSPFFIFFWRIPLAAGRVLQGSAFRYILNGARLTSGTI